MSSSANSGEANRKVVAPYGGWQSPITSALIVEDSVSFGDIAVRGNAIYWSETRPNEDARSVIARRVIGKADPAAGSRAISGGDITPREFSARSRVHEYGGGAFCVGDDYDADGGDIVYFSNLSDGRVYRQRVGADGAVDAPQPLTPAADMRYADGVVCDRRRLMICVREDHTSDWREPVNAIVAVDLRSGASRVIASGNDFYSNPRVSPDGRLLAWLAWNHPNMPWDGCELWAGALGADGSVADARRVAGGRDEAVFQPEWSPSGALHFVSDRGGWWNIYRCRDLDGDAAEPVCAMDAEFGMPAWVFGLSTYGFASDERIICAYTRNGLWHIGELDTTTGALSDFPTTASDIGCLRVSPRYALYTGSDVTSPARLTLHCLNNQDNPADLGDSPYAPDGSGGIVLRQSSDAVERLAGDGGLGRRASAGPDVSGLLSRPQAVEFPTSGGKTAYAFYYPPANPDCAAPADEKPPLIVISHGGPTSMAGAGLDLRKQFWTSRGFALLDVNYGGSAGYGREYRRRLNGAWGVVDVDDCVNGALHLVERGLADGDRLIIRGSSAGGFTTLLALTTRDAFSAGASYYGICELEALMRDTHKFESRYLDTLIGAFPAAADLYRERSAINHIDGLSAPMIVMQGLDDEIVPPNQAEMMVNALREKGLPVAYLTFEGERHGFRKAENIRRALDAELYFYSRVFGFDLPGADGAAQADPPARIHNLPGA